MDNMEHTLPPDQGTSQLPQPSRMTTPKKLSELSAAANNARQVSMLPPPQAGMKRKTLAERAGEAPRPAPAPPGSRIAGPTARAAPMTRSMQQHGSASSMYSRPASAASSRTASTTSSFSAQGSDRFQGASTYRSQTAMSHHAKSKSVYGQSRPMTSTNGAMGSLRNGQVDPPANSMPFVSLRKCSANTSRRKMPQFTPPRVSSDEPSDHGDVLNTTLNERTVQSLRNISLNTAMGSLSIGPGHRARAASPAKGIPATPTPVLPKPKSSAILCSPSPVRSPRSSKKNLSRDNLFLNKFTNTKMPDWDLGSRVENMESMYADLKASLNTSTAESNSLKESMALYKARVCELEELRSKGTQENAMLQADIQRYKMEIASLSTSVDDWKRKYNDEVCSATKLAEDHRRTHANEIDDVQRSHRRDMNRVLEEAEQAERRKEKAYEEKLSDMKRKYETALEEEEDRRRKAIKEVSSEGSLVQQKLEGAMSAKEKEILALREEVDRCRQETAHQMDINRDLRSKLSESASLATANDSTMRSLKATIEFLESDSKSQSQAFGDLERRTREAVLEADEAKAKLRAEETLRRKLHNQVQELRGNIRVFCRIRPTLDAEDSSDKAQITYPDVADDCKEVEVLGPEEKSSLGKISCKKNAFSFDRVFTPSTNNSAVFDEISQLVQSALDGYNVCIFCYGQTGSGKTFTMSSEDGMIPRAVNQIFKTAESLEEKGWRYKIEGSFVEVYNENISDLLGRAEDFDKKKHEIHHDMERCKTTITDVTNVQLNSGAELEKVLRKAMNNRSVAATKANERSSRSHSVFILRLTGENSITGERSEGTLNLVDLAGSERLSHSGATGERLKETQNINKSLSCLGDVISALGQGREGGHIPYRNSKFSLGGNSKTLMFVMVSPFKDHLGETLTSLRFATKVHNTHIGTAKRQARVTN